MTVSVSLSLLASVCMCVCVSLQGMCLAIVSHFVSGCMCQRIHRELLCSIVDSHIACVAMWYLPACPCVASAGPDGAPCMLKGSFKKCGPWSFESQALLVANHVLHPMIHFVISLSDIVACRLSATFL
jgi:hypothetical protein